jgi:alpha-D-xyloside xylohydrolase
MRPLFLDHPEDDQAWDVDDQFLFGPDILVAPVYAPAVGGREVYLPENDRWIDVATGLVADGGTTIEVAAPLERIPVFVRDGADVLHVLQATGGRP